MNLQIYRLFRGMHNRCYNPSVKSYKDYGARGIYVVERWHGKQGVHNFIQDMGERPAGYTLERIDNNGPYGPENCKWASRIEQASNKRNNHYLTVNGETHTLSEWARRMNCSSGALWYRINKGWSPEDTVLTPIPERPNAKLNKDGVLFIRANYPEMTVQKIATHLGVSKKTVLNVLHGKNFRDI